MALTLYKNELHDYEETVLTIKKVATNLFSMEFKNLWFAQTIRD